MKRQKPIILLQNWYQFIVILQFSLRGNCIRFIFCPHMVLIPQNVYNLVTLVYTFFWINFLGPISCDFIKISDISHDYIWQTGVRNYVSLKLFSNLISAQKLGKMDQDCQLDDSVQLKPLWVLSLGTLDRFGNFLNNLKTLRTEEPDRQLRDWRGLQDQANLSLEQRERVKASKNKAGKVSFIYDVRV